MIGQFTRAPQNKGTPTCDRHPMFNKSNQVSSILYGSQDMNSSNCSHFVDQLQRFRRDFAGFHKKEQEIKRQQVHAHLQKKYQEKENFLRTLEFKNKEDQYKKSLQHSVSLQLFDLGVKRNGMTSGEPVNPINHQYMDSYGGKKLQENESESKLNKMVRMHHLQSKGTCGYNVINGKWNTPVEYQVPQEQQEGMHSRILNYQEHYRLRVPES